MRQAVENALRRRLRLAELDTLAEAETAARRLVDALGGWLETKTIKGHRYRYRCWREHGHRRSEYLGPVARGGHEKA
jgi:hypothetical protein